MNIASVAGLVDGMPFTPLSNYHASKWGVVAYTRQFSESHPTDNPWLRDGVKCYCLCPWFVDTPMIQNSAFDIAKKKAAEMVLGLGKYLSPIDVVNAFETSLENDVNGSAVAVLPGACQIKVPNFNPLPLNATFILTKILQLVFPNANGFNASHVIMFLTAVLAISSFLLGYGIALFN